MNIVVVDDEKMALESMKSAILKNDPECEVHTFRLAAEAYDYIVENDTDVAFLDIEMIDISGIEFAKNLKLVKPELNIIFATGYDEFLKDAFDMHASGYLLKPVTPEKVRKELDNLRYPVVFKNNKDKRIRFSCFGNFEAYIDNMPIKFKYSKSKEALAYMVDRCGSLCTNNEIMAALWEDDTHESYLKNIKRDLVDIFEKSGLDDVLVKQRNYIGINKNSVKCDFYDMQAGMPYAINLYRGEYMEQYSWAEFTRGKLEM